MKIFNKANFDTIILIVIIMILIGIVYLMKKRSTNNKAFHEIPIEENVLTSKVFPKNPLPKNISTSKVFHDTLLAENVSISSEEKEIDVQDLLKFEKERHFISVVLAPPLEDDLMEPGIKTPSGEIINPDIKLIDEDGNQYPLIYIGGRGKKIVNYGYDGKLPTDKIYKKVSLKSDFPIKAEKVLWSGYNWKDRK